MSLATSSATAEKTARFSYGYFALITLTLLNLLNYVDRFIFAALIPYIKQDTGYTDQQLGWVGSAFTIIYTVCSPLFGYLGDRYRRGRLIAIGIAIWSLATAAAGLAKNFIQLLLSRSAVGVGEANYATIAPGLLSDFFRSLAVEWS
jgi:MFS family permease